ncbi:MAG TPA: helix-turn-helix domain-containing protein, partial [Ktedonobacterales bacterium]|nr:helix-turn-helix domain-containing protein [Ktedonobacterales bacterium]
MAAPSPSSVTFADLLRHHRTAAGLTQEELAARAQLSRDAISTLERGTRRRPRKDTIALLAEALALPDEERAALVAASRRSSAAALAATPPAQAPADLDGHDAALGFAGAAPAAADVTLPHGVVTFLFAEVADSTRLLHELGGDRYAGVLAEVQTLLGTLWAANAGHELGTQGDRFFAVFAYADNALAAAAAAQQALAAHAWPDSTVVRLRMGVHSGAALLTAGRYVGLEVQQASHVAASGHGGQIVVSQAVVDQVAKFGYALPEGTSLRDLGAHRLSGLGRRERLFQLMLPVLPGLPVIFPRLRTLDTWPVVRAELVLVGALTLLLLTVAGLLLPLVVPTFPRALGLVACGVTLVLLATGGVAVVLLRRNGQVPGGSWPQGFMLPLTLPLTLPWRDVRKGMAAVVSVLLCLVIVVTTLFVTKPTVLGSSQPRGYDFSYTYHAPTHRGGSITIGLWEPLPTLTPFDFGFSAGPYAGLGSGCVVQLPDLTLGLRGWKPDQCTEVPSLANGGESVDEKTTTFHIDPRAVWSDGQPITADDYLFAFHLLTDPNVGG